MNRFTFVGKIKKNTVSYEEKEIGSSSGPMSIRNIKFSMSCGDNLMRLERNSIKFPNGKILTYKANQGGAGEKLEVDWVDRFNPEIISQVAYYRRFILEPDVRVDGKATESKKEFIHEYDYTEMLNQYFTNDLNENDIYLVSGNVDFEYNPDKDQYYRRFVPNVVRKMPPDTPMASQALLEVCLVNGCFKKREDEESEDLEALLYIPYYDRKGKGTKFAPFSVIARGEKATTIVQMLSMNLPNKEMVYKTSMVFDLIHGAQKVDITEDMLNDYQKSLISFGLCTFEEIARDLGGQAYGDSIVENLVADLAKESRKAPPAETNYTFEDLGIRKKFVEAKEDLPEIVSEEGEIDLFSDNGDESFL